MIWLATMHGRSNGNKHLLMYLW